MNLFKLLFAPASVKRAEALSNRLARATEVIDAAAWELDSALSALNKDAAGYRTANAANPDGGANATEGELELAVKRAADLEPILAQIETLAHRWASEDRAYAKLATVFNHLGDHAQV